MSDFIIDPSSVSFSQIKKDLLVHIANLPSTQQYRNFFRGESQQIIVDLIAGLAAYNRYSDIASTKENYLAYTNNRVNGIGVSSSIGYNAYRGRNQIIQLRVTPDRDFLLEKYVPCGSVNGVDFSPLTTYTLLAGIPITLQCVIGEVATESITVPDSRLQEFVFPINRVSQDLKVLLNNSEVPFGLDPDVMLDNLYYVQSNGFGGVTIKYLNNNLPNNILPLYPYNTGDILSIVYVTLHNLSYVFPNALQFFYGIIDPLHVDTTILVNYRSPESLDSIKINAPLNSELQKTIRGREDYSKRLRLLNSDFIDTNGRDVNIPVIYLDEVMTIPALVDVTYVKKDYTLLLPSEVVSIETQLNYQRGVRPHGIPPSKLTHPKQVDLRLNLTLTKKPNTDNSTYVSDIQSIFDNYFDERGLKQLRNGKLQFNFNLKNLEFDIERLSYVLIARASIYTKTWQASTNFKRGEFLLPTVSNGFMYEVISDTYQFNNLLNTNPNVGVLSGVTEPVWSIVSNQNVYEGVNVWTPATPYIAGNFIKSTNPNSFLFKCKVAGTSGAIEPNYGGIVNEMFFDNTVTWQVVDPNAYTAGLVYRVHNINEYSFTNFWNEYYILNYGVGVTWL